MLRARPVGDGALHRQERGGVVVEKDGALSVDVTSVDLTQADPITAFPDPSCDPKVADCLAALPAGEADTGDCGTVQEVRACEGD